MPQPQTRATHSAGAYWVWPNNATGVHNSNRHADLISNTSNEPRTVNTVNAGQKVWYYNQEFANCAASVNLPAATGQNPPGNMNGPIDRSTAFANAVVVLTDMPAFNKADGTTQGAAENFTKRTVSL